MPFDLSDYKDVAARIADLKAQYPEASLQPLNPEKPYDIVSFDDEEGNTKVYVVYVAACYRHEADEHPGVGVAWEPIPGKTNYTRTSELMNAETSAWGRAIVAALASESRSIASAEEVRNRRSDDEGRTYGSGTGSTTPTENQLKFLHAKAREAGLDEHELNEFAARVVGTNVAGLTKASASKLIDAVKNSKPLVGAPDYPLHDQSEAF